MTAYTDKEDSVHDGFPIEGYEFLGTYDTYRYTNVETEQTILGETYTPLPTVRSAVSSGTQDDDSNELRIEIPVDTPLVQDYAFDNSPPTLDLTVYRVHVGTDFATDAVVFWRGSVNSFSISGDMATAIVPSVFNLALFTQIPTFYYQNNCNHVLFDSRCKVDRNLFSTNTTVVNVDATMSLVTLQDLSPIISGDSLIGGEVFNITTNEKRLISGHTVPSNSVTVNYPFNNINIGDAVEVTAGCNHTYTECGVKFSNKPNYGGFPLVPTVNPFEVDVFAGKGL